MRTIDGDGRKVVQIGESFDVSGNVLTTDTITAYELSHKYNKSITALVNGQYVGWGYIPFFINYKYNLEYYNPDSISDITYWHDRKSGEFCRYHAMVLIACGGHDSKQYYSDRLSDEENEKYLTNVRGRVLEKSKTQIINFKTRNK